MLAGGTSVIKWNQDEKGRNTLSAFRIDRTLISTDENGEVTDAVFFVALLSTLKNREQQSTYWLVEERKYNEDGKPVLIYKVFVTLPRFLPPMK